MKIYAIAEITILPNMLPKICRKEGVQSQRLSVMVDTGITAKSVKDFERIIKCADFEGGTYVPIPEEITPRRVKEHPKQYDLELVGGVDEDTPAS